jgi:integrase
MLPQWGKRAFHELKRSDVAKLFDHIEDQHGARTADYCLAIVRPMFAWYARRNDDYFNPVLGAEQRYKPSEHRRSRILGPLRTDGKPDDDELRAFWQACGKAGMFGAMCKVLLLTGQRREKVVTMRWDDIADGVWTIPTAPREKSNAKLLRLPQAVLDIVSGQPRVLGNPYVFPGRGGGPFNNFSASKAALNRAMPAGTPPWRTHDLRRTARSLMSRAGVRPDIAERVLGHAIRGVEGTYDRYSYADEKADALRALATLVERILNPPADNVVPLRAT